MKFSVIVPVYNVREYISECCDSIFNQTYQNFELILVDDGSTDGSGNICDHLVQENQNRVKVLHTENCGALCARTLGVHESNGDVVVFLDGDDCIHTELLQKLFQTFKDSKCDIVLFNASKKSDFTVDDYRFPFSGNSTCFEVNKKEFYSQVVLSNVPNSVCLKAVSRRCLENIPDFSDYSYVKNGEDLLLSLYMITAADKIVYLDETLYYYRQRAGSVVHSFNLNRCNSIKTVHIEMERFIDIWNMPELHSNHYAREVKGWIETLLILFDNKENIKSSCFVENLNAMAQDSYFRDAYEAMNKKVLHPKILFLAKCLYQKQFLLLHVTNYFRNIKKKIYNFK